MSTTKHVLSSGNFLQTWSDTSQISANDDWSGVPSIVGYRTGDVTSATSVDARTILTDTGFVQHVIANVTNQTGVSGGIQELEIANPTIAFQGANANDYAALVIYLDATGREDIVVSFNIRDLDVGADNAVQQVNVQYRVGNSGTWTNVPGGYTADATTAGSGTQVTAVSVTLPADANNAADLQVRILTTNAAGNDELIGIDDIGVASAAAPFEVNGSFAIGDVTVTEGSGANTPMTFTVNRSQGTQGQVSVDYTITFNTAAADDFVTQTFSGTLTFADGDASESIDLLVNGDFIPEATDTFTVTLSNAQGGAVIGDATATGTITNDDTGPIAISVIQGASHTSPLVGQGVTTSGIVTAVDSNGFYIQDPTGDGNDATSEGIFVFTSSAPTVSIGDSVNVTGTVTEFVANSASLSVTEITSPVIVVNSTGNTLPAATVIGAGGRTPPTENYEDDNFTSFNPATDALDFYESMEGMRVTIQAPLVVANTNSFGETHVVASGGAGATGINDRGGITVSEGDFNPERIQIDNDSNLSPGYNPNHSQGDILGDVTGILNYAFSNYEVLVTAPVTTTTDVTLGQETTTLDGTADRLTIASYNVENLDPTDPQSKFDAIASQIVNNLSAPDIVGLQEIQDADGAGTGTNYSGQATADKLIAAIVAAGGPTYQYIEIAPTSNSTNNGEPNGNIRNGFLYNPERVTYVAGSAEIVPGAAASGARFPLAADFVFNGETVTVINVHFTSRGGSEPLMGDNQPPANGGDSARLAQAQALRAYIDSLAAGDPELNIVTLGDFNSFYFEAPLQTLQAGGAQNNLHLLLPEEERYTYMFEGNLQALDNILVGPNLNLTSEFDAVHLNAEQPAGTAKPTDHDPTLAEILISANDVISSTSGDDVRRSGVGDDLFYLTLGGNDTASGGNGNDVFLFGGSMTSADKVDGGEGMDQIVLQGDYSAGLTLGAEVISVESLSILPGNDTRAGGSGEGLFDYVITTVDANVAAGTQLTVDANRLRFDEDFTFDGSAESDGSFLIYGGGGTDDLTGGANNDVFFFGPQGQWGATDQVDGGSGGIDQLALRGDYTITFGETQLLSIESLSLLSAAGTRAGALGETYDYDLTMDDGNVADGVQMTVDAAQLRAGETLTFDGSDESDGSFRVFGGAGDDEIGGSDNADILAGRLGADLMTGNGGNDIFRFNGADESMPGASDEIRDFTLGDIIDLARIDADTTMEGNQAFTFIGGESFGNKAGELRFEHVTGSTWLIQGDRDGNGESDFEVTLVIADSDPITSSDFFL